MMPSVGKRWSLIPIGSVSKAMRHTGPWRSPGPETGSRIAAAGVGAGELGVRGEPIVRADGTVQIRPGHLAEDVPGADPALDDAGVGVHEGGLADVTDGVFF